MTAGQDDDEAAASLGLGKISGFIYTFGWTELYFTAFVKQPVPNCSSLQYEVISVNRCMTRVVSTLQDRCISGSHGWALWCRPNTVLGRHWSMLSATLPHCPAAWTVMYDFRDINLDSWTVSATRHTGSICCDRHCQIPLIWCSYDSCRNGRIRFQHNMSVEMPFWN